MVAEISELPEPSMHKQVKTTMATLRAMLNPDYADSPTPAMEEVLTEPVTNAVPRGQDEQKKSGTQSLQLHPQESDSYYKFPGFSDNIGVRRKGDGTKHGDRCLVFAVPSVYKQLKPLDNKLPADFLMDYSGEEARGILMLQRMYGFVSSAIQPNGQVLDNVAPDFGMDSVLLSVSPKLLISLVLLLLTNK
jgi:hypothetical protein